MTPMGSLVPMSSRMRAGEASGESRSIPARGPRRPDGRLALALAEAPQRGGDAQHLRAGQGLRERVGDPVDRLVRAPRDEPDPVPVAVDAQLAAVPDDDLGGIV